MIHDQKKFNYRIFNIFIVATDEIVALKQIKFDQALTHEGFPIAAMREIGVLLALSHESIVTVREMVVGDAFDKVFMVMEVSPTYFYYYYYCLTIGSVITFIVSYFLQ